MKELYTKPELELEKFNTVDVLTASQNDEFNIPGGDGGME